MSNAKTCCLLWAFLASSSSHAVCNLNATSVNFGAYDVFSMTPVDSTGTIDVSCLPRAAVTITLNTGIGSYANRKMANGTEYLNYNLYRNAARNRILGDGSAGTEFFQANNVRNRSFIVYGRVPARQNVPAGIYSDLIVVTLTF